MSIDTVWATWVRDADADRAWAVWASETTAYEPPRRKTLAVDFDGVVHRYSKGWQGGAIYDPPVRGTTSALHKLSQRYELVLFTAREDLAAVRRWLVYHNLHHLFADVTNRKPAAWAYVDDRGVRFSSWEQALKTLAFYDPSETKVTPGGPRDTWAPLT